MRDAHYLITMLNAISDRNDYYLDLSAINFIKTFPYGTFNYTSTNRNSSIENTLYHLLDYIFIQYFRCSLTMDIEENQDGYDEYWYSESPVYVPTADTYSITEIINDILQES